ncbi:MAG: hypothetical protein CM1200mP2_47590 [Planctomycetaceae bacterium]|nr:MAG: hypothetical protein CM1200mP2_47590 [Planctomycetaceae bacterium]
MTDLSAMGSRSRAKGSRTVSSVRKGFRADTHTWSPVRARVASTIPRKLTTPRTPMARVWNVFSLQNATIAPQLPAARATATHSARTQAICSQPTPPSRCTRKNTGTETPSSTMTISRLEPSLPRTSSREVRSDISSSSSVRRSFSWAMLPAQKINAKNSTSGSWTNEKISNSRPPKRAVSPMLRTCCQPNTAWSAVYIRTNSAAT